MTILKGQRTRILSGAVFALGLVELLDPELLATASGVGEQGRAIVLLIIGVLIFVFRQLTTTAPGQWQTNPGWKIDRPGINSDAGKEE